ncbi:hypothetical protein MJO28_001484 [Puccinia striiformis f. sp. tritici]|uniref:Mediator of RNA polymerase II transcription subunit 18 n=2 Tax=Puccinia striiformis TaxID=27350 RepID=A0A2S4W3B9_9BASI|nr:hypothetical protein MJO28_001484 [Puccinia striiformis f. sp. tritici]KAI7965774.1 hypothetical protein MJO29_001522 [Puccinia striiformis f. sp. tritici]POW16283.1 hypothetical protein PSTT_01509 [Puccinia striiformis]
MSTELSVTGLIPSQPLYADIVNRLANHSHSHSAFNAHSITFDRGPLQTISEDSSLLRLNHTIRTQEIPQNQSPSNYKNPIRNGWSLTSLGRIEPERLSPDFLIRPTYICPIIAGNPREFVNALGYRQKFEYYRRGVQFIRGAVIIEIFRVYKNEKDEEPITGSKAHIITVTYIIPAIIRSSSTSGPAPGTTTTTTGQPNSKVNTGPTTQELRIEAGNRVREIQAILKGLVDLGRVEPF